MRRGGLLILCSRGCWSCGWCWWHVPRSIRPSSQSIGCSDSADCSAGQLSRLSSALMLLLPFLATELEYPTDAQDFWCRRVGKSCTGDNRLGSWTHDDERRGARGLVPSDEVTWKPTSDHRTCLMLPLVCRDYGNCATDTPVISNTQHMPRLKSTQLIKGLLLSTSFLNPSLGHFPHWTCPPSTYSSGHFPARTISLPTSDIHPAVKEKIWKLAPTHTPDPNRSPLSMLYSLTLDRFTL